MRKLVLLSAAVLSAATSSKRDHVVVGNPSGHQTGLLVDGASKCGPSNDRVKVSSQSTIDVCAVTPAAGSNEVIAFTEDRPPALAPATWTSGSDTVPVSFAQPFAVEVQIWIVKGPFTDQKDRAVDAAAHASWVWIRERMGVNFQFSFTDATTNPNAAQYYDFDCAKQSGMEADIGKTVGAINVYYVDRVDQKQNSAKTCKIGTDFAAMGSTTNRTVLAHELGHDLALEHVDMFPPPLSDYFDPTNVMHSYSNTRRYFTEGQVFRAHFTSTSAINSILNLRSGPTRDCASDQADDQCPALQKRIWDDGAFPRN